MNELPRDIARLLAQDVETVCRELLPNGKRVGQEWVTGDSDDSAGSSLKVRLSGEKTGLWADFGGEGKGDLLGLWCACRHVSLGKAMKQAKQFLKIEDVKAYPVSDKQYQRPRRNPAWRAVAKTPEPAPDAPEAPPIPDTPVTAYLKSRGITEETMRAFRLGEMAGDAQPFHKLAGNPGTIVFPSFRVYDDAPAELISVKYLALKRDVSKDGKEIKHTQLSGSGFESVLFGWQALDPNTRTVALSEGEVDCLSLHQYGFSALSVPMGAGKGDNQKKWVDNEYPFLERFDVIYLCMDMDKAGQDVVMELVERLGRHRCKIVKLPHKDANECLKQGVTLKELAACFREADYVAPADLKVAKDFVDQVKALNNPTSMAAVGVPLPWAFTYAYNKFAFRPGEFTVWSGYLGHGKTTLLSHALIHAISLNQVCCVASLEIPGAVSVLKFCRQVTCREQPSDAEIDTAVNWLGDRLYLYDKIGDSPMTDILEVFQYARQRYGATQLVIDSMMMLGIGEDDWNKQAKVGKQLVTFAREHNCHIHLVAHPKKAKDSVQEAVSSDVKGSGTLTNVANNVLLVWQNKKKVLAKRDQELRGVPIPYDLEQEPDAVLTIDKNRATGWTAKIPLWFNSPSTQFLSNSAQLPTLYAPTVTVDPAVIDEPTFEV
jgi:twinkle protein